MVCSLPRCGSLSRYPLLKTCLNIFMEDVVWVELHKAHKLRVWSILSMDTHKFQISKFNTSYCIFHKSKITLNKVTLNEGTTKQGTTNKVTLNKITLNKITLNKITLNKITLNKITLNKITLNKITLNKITLNKVTLN